MHPWQCVASRLPQELDAGMFASGAALLDGPEEHLWVIREGQAKDFVNDVRERLRRINPDSIR